MNNREIIFRGRRKDTGEWVEGDYSHYIRKCNKHMIRVKKLNEEHEIYRESLQLMGYDDKFYDFELFCHC